MEEGGCEAWSRWGGYADLESRAGAKGRATRDGEACGAFGLGCAEFEGRASEVLEAGSWDECVGTITIDGDGSRGLGL